jgi:CRP/FNR family transcriptional regulator, cyclic AMP receptor protein
MAGGLLVTAVPALRDDSAVARMPHRVADTVPADRIGMNMSASPQRGARSAVAMCAAILRQSALFRGLPDALIEHVLAHAHERRLRERDMLFLKGEPSDHVAVMLGGTVYKILFGPKGQELILDTIETGDLVDEMALVEDRPRSFTAIAYGPVWLLSVPRRHFSPLRANTAFMQRIHDLMYARMRKTVDTMEIMCLHRLESRLARHLLATIDTQTGADGGAGGGARRRPEQMLAHTAGSSTGNGARHNPVEVALPPTQSILAAMINASRPKLNAQLQQWQRTGLITCAGNTIVIHDVEALRGKACLGRIARMSTSAAR